jgi:hypothetical protein
MKSNMSFVAVKNGYKLLSKCSKQGVVGFRSDSVTTSIMLVVSFYPTKSSSAKATTGQGRFELRTIRGADKFKKRGIAFSGETKDGDVLKCISHAKLYCVLCGSFYTVIIF